ncbi:MAG: hypothetical protein J0H66_03995 [Solirubrobacterales bacterium]|nr:hypothetical protein [Solirubrobacterales bacterium]
MGVAVGSAVLAVAGCGGVAELDSDELETVSQARSVATAAAASGSLKPAGEEKLEALMILCHEKPLAEADGDSVREVMSELTPKVRSADPAFFKRMKRAADHGCD